MKTERDWCSAKSDEVGINGPMALTDSPAFFDQRRERELRFVECQLWAKQCSIFSSSVLVRTISFAVDKNLFRSAFA